METYYHPSDLSIEKNLKVWSTFFTENYARILQDGGIRTIIEVTLKSLM